jgi:hypothetical protein
VNLPAEFVFGGDAAWTDARHPQRLPSPHMIAS